MHVKRDNVSQEKFNQRLNDALEEIGLTRDEFNAIAEKERFMYRINIIDYFKHHSKRNLK